MELGLSLGDASKPFKFLIQNNSQKHKSKACLDFSISLGLNSHEKTQKKSHENDDYNQTSEEPDESDDEDDNERESTPLQLNLLPAVPAVPRQIFQSLPWSSDNGSSENGSAANRFPAAAEEVSSANSAGSPPLHLDFGGIYRRANVVGNKRDFEANDAVLEAERTASDDDENGLNTRKKLRLSKEQSAFLEESFKEHNTLNPKQKQALAKQLNLRPRQVEVWFQNRRARTKLKQTEVDCEYLKRCCETLTEENRRLHKELQDLRALKSSNSNPFYMQLPATTLTMCPSCERVATTTTTNNAATRGKTGKPDSVPKGIPFPITRPRFYPFSQNSAHPNQHKAS